MLNVRRGEKKLLEFARKWKDQEEDFILQREKKDDLTRETELSLEVPSVET